MKARNKILLHYDAILFDVDGTLIDSAPGIIHTLQEVFCTMGVDVSGINLRRYLGPPLRKSFGEHFNDPALIEKATELYRTSYAVKGSHECAVFPGVLQMLQTLKDAGFLLCTATSKPTKVVTPILEEQGLAQYFDFIGGASMICGALPTAVWMLPVCCTATAAGKSWNPSIRCCWPKAAPTLPIGCWQPGYDRKFHSFGRRMDRI